MRGTKAPQSSMICLISTESRIPERHPLRAVKKLVDAALKDLAPVFEGMYSNIGRPSIPPESLLKATLLMALYSVRSDRMFCEQLDYNILFRWFLDMDMAELRARRHPDLHGPAPSGGLSLQTFSVFCDRLGRNHIGVITTFP